MSEYIIVKPIIIWTLRSVRFPNRTRWVWDMGMSEYAYGILNWLGNRTYQGECYENAICFLDFS